MVQEIFMLEVISGLERDFEQAFNQAKGLLSTSKGYLGAELKRCVEQENKYLVSVSWESVEAHVHNFKKTPEFVEMKKLLGPFYLSIPNVQHYEKVS
ncbi:antibiotic biosynthesis monooxygenase family protein [Oceanobacillus salinisoli]|uniref:antibiotic biosynthesis monooxygenase family protein n=1 Tax=Oceanobacillus salinisoli TaxID=2678611 RepID=UPI0012E21D0C|nr:antibiotic biosynthesis monooxygenase [Oceanobacillus salinisoli]